MDNHPATPTPSYPLTGPGLARDCGSSRFQIDGRISGGSSSGDHSSLGSTRSRLTGTKSPTIANSATPVRQLNTSFTSARGPKRAGAGAGANGEWQRGEDEATHWRIFCSMETTSGCASLQLHSRPSGKPAAARCLTTQTTSLLSHYFTPTSRTSSPSLITKTTKTQLHCGRKGAPSLL